MELSDEPQRIDLKVVINQCLDALREESERQKIVIRRDWSPESKFPWFGVPGHLSHAIANLVQNCIRYAYRGEGNVDIRLAGDETSSYRVEVEDYGVGIPKEIIHRLSDRFAPSDGSSNRLGIPMTNYIAARFLGGELRCTTAEGKGTKFVLTLPRSR
jgi:signal transduction histidine kinase